MAKEAQLASQTENRETLFAWVLFKSDPTQKQSYCLNGLLCNQAEFYADQQTLLREYADAARAYNIVLSCTYCILIKPSFDEITSGPEEPSLLQFLFGVGANHDVLPVSLSHQSPALVGDRLLLKRLAEGDPTRRQPRGGA
jgi:hypothetical protein